MSEEFYSQFIFYCRNIEDYRQPVKRTYPLEEIIFLVFCATLSGCDGWDEMVFYGNNNIDFLKKYLPYEHGIPSSSTILRVISTLSPQGFEKQFREWFMRYNQAKQISIDGKVLKASKTAQESALHLLHACDSSKGLILGYKKVAGKTNEVKVLPELLEDLNIEDRTVTIDAMGCQREVCKKIIEKGGNYVISLKGNQGTLHSDIKLLFSDKDELNISTHQTVEKGHGRIEIREMWATEELDCLIEQHNWPGLKTAIMCKYQRLDKKTKPEILYYISSHKAQAKNLLEIVRSHWKVESMHWILDVSFSEDKIAISVDNAAENLACIRRVALNLIKAFQQNTANSKLSIKRIRKLCLMKPHTISDILKLNTYDAFS